MAQTKAADEPLFKALLTPHRSLGRTGFHILMGTFLVIWLTLGSIFLAMGAWPVFGFLGLEVLLIYLAFRWSYRSGRAREEVEVSRTRLDIRKFAPSGRMEAHRFNPFWTRFRVARHEEIAPRDFVKRGASVVGELATATYSDGQALLEISARGVSKASTLAAFCAERGIGPDQVVAFGDMPNDLLMLEWAGMSYAMANAHPDVIAAADRVCAPNHEDGVAQVLEQLFR
jgi:uncharacterized membrane protein